MKYLAIVGSRTVPLDKYQKFEHIITETMEKYNCEGLVSGGANGADKYAEIYADKFNIPIKIFKPDWNKYGKSAGYVRNKDIIRICEVCIAIWDGKSKGTKMDIDLCKLYRKHCDIYTFNLK